MLAREAGAARSASGSPATKGAGAASADGNSAGERWQPETGEPDDPAAPAAAAPSPGGRAGGGGGAESGGGGVSWLAALLQRTLANATVAVSNMVRVVTNCCCFAQAPARYCRLF